ncbi:ribosome biogenesis protein SLX9-domain-containing protein [Cryomyces antarcticus]
MAPTVSKPRVGRHTGARAAKSPRDAIAHPRSTYLPSSLSDSAFAPSKKDKRTIKHSAFLNRIEKAPIKRNKRRRPSKKLVANLESLVDALPDLDDVDGDEWEGVEDEGGDGDVSVTRRVGGSDGMVKIKQKSLRSRPGAMKRKEKMEKIERERFDKNLAQMAYRGAGAIGSQGVSHAELTQMSSSTAATGTQSTSQLGQEAGSEQKRAPPTSDRWAALRGFISQTMEQMPEFRKS